MQVLLRDDVQDLGSLGDVVEVKRGFARNYLLPKGLAVLVTQSNLRQIESAKDARRQRDSDELERVNRQAELLEGFLCYLPVRANEKGHLFGSVGPDQIAAHLIESGFEGIRPSNIDMPEHIEQIGDFDVEIMLHPKVRAHVTVRVAAEEAID